jgi:hypothetical protein
MTHIVCQKLTINKSVNFIGLAIVPGPASAVAIGLALLIVALFYRRR